MHPYQRWFLFSAGLLSIIGGPALAQLPHAVPGGFDLANGWHITPAGKAIGTEDMVLKLVAAPDGRVVIASHSGYNPHGMVVIDAKTQEPLQRIGLKSTWMGMAWSRDGATLNVSGDRKSTRLNSSH